MRLRICFLMLMLQCTPSQSPNPNDQTDTAVDRSESGHIGELERLGKDGQDVLVVGVDAEGFDELSLEQKRLAYFLYRAAIAGNDIFTDQAHRYALEIKALLETIFLNSSELEPRVRDAVHDYLKYFWINHGQYGAQSHAKYLPNDLTFEMLQAAAHQVTDRGGKRDLQPGESLDQKLERLRPHIFDLDFEPLQNNQQKGEDILATSHVNLYAPEVTQDAFDHLSPDWQGRLNVRFGFENGKIVPHPYRIGGLYDRDLKTIRYWLQKALSLAESEEQRRGLELLIEYYESGEEEKYRQHSIQWLKSRTTIDYLNGFIEQYIDPRGVIGQFEANVTFTSDSRLITHLAAAADYFEAKMPWPAKYRRSKVTPPIANVVQIILGVGDAGPNSPVAYNLPNYSDIRRDFGSKNIILYNVQEAKSGGIRKQIIDEFYLPKHRENYREYGKIGRRWEVYMHEVIGHGSGKPEDDLQSDPRTLLGRAYSALEECRADLVALYHILDPKLVEIGAFSAQQQLKVAEAQYIGHLQGHMNRYRSLQDDNVREAHRKGRELVLRYLVEGGEEQDQDYGVRVVQVDGNYYVEIVDLSKAHQGIARLLGTLQTMKSKGDAEAAAQIFDRFGTRVNPTWRDNITARADRLKIPKEVAVVFPQLIPVLEADEIVDVRLETKEDLTRQQLRFSSWRFNTELWPPNQ